MMQIRIVTSSSDNFLLAPRVHLFIPVQSFTLKITVTTHSGVLRRPFLSFFPYKDTQNQKCPFKSLQGLKPVLFLLNLPQKWDILGI